MVLVAYTQIGLYNGIPVGVIINGHIFEIITSNPVSEEKVVEIEFTTKKICGFINETKVVLFPKGEIYYASGFKKVPKELWPTIQWPIRTGAVSKTNDPMARHRYTVHELSNGTIVFNDTGMLLTEQQIKTVAWNDE